MNKNTWKGVLVFAVVFLVAITPFSGAVSAYHEAGGIVKNVAPTTDPTKHSGIIALVVNDNGDGSNDNSGTDSVYINCTAYDRNGDTDDEIVQASCWLCIKNATGTEVKNWTTFAWDTGTGAVLDPGTVANDGLFFITDNAADNVPDIVWTIPSDKGTGTWNVTIYIVDEDGASDTQYFDFTVVAAIEVLGIYNYTGIANDTSSPYQWNFTTTYPGTLNVTSGNYSYTGTDDPSNNYGYDNDTGRLYSFWLVVKNVGGANQQFNLTFVNDTFNSASRNDDITIDGVIDFEYYNTTIEPGTGAGDPNDQPTTYYIFDDSDGIVTFTFDGTDKYFWIRFMIDIPDPCADATDYECPFTVTAT